MFIVGPMGCVARGLAYTDFLVVAAGRVAVGVGDGGGQMGRGLGSRDDGTYKVGDFLIAWKKGATAQFRRKERAET
jgi:hypothetical protein